MKVTYSDLLYIVDPPFVDDYSSWKVFALAKTDYWRGFYDKWVRKEIRAKRYVCDYKDLVEDPYNEIKSIVEFISDGVVDDSKIRIIVESNDISRKNDFRHFKYYDADFFEFLKKRLGQ